MKRIHKFFTESAVALAVAALLPSCAMDEPFGDKGSGNLTMTTDIRGDVQVNRTRAISDDELVSLREKCVVYIENSKGIVRKYKGLDNIPQNINLKVGHYVAEGWSGDSVSASFDKKFYRGWQEFDMAEGENSLTLKCNIANVLVSVDPASLDVDLNNLKITFSHSHGELVFDESNLADAKGYFMMPNADKNLNYKVEGTTLAGESFTKEGVIENVQRAHEYRMTVSNDPSPITTGGGLIRLTIADIPVIEDDIIIYTAPAIVGEGFNIEEQIVGMEKDFTDKIVYVRGYFGLSSLVMNFSDNFGIASGRNVLDGTVKTELAQRGINVESKTSRDAASNGVEVEVGEVYITFTQAFLNGLADSNDEYKVTFEAVDGRHKSNSGSIRFANTPDAVEKLDPVKSVEIPADDMLAVGARSVTLTGNLYTPDATNYGIKYREQGTSEWSVAYPSSASAAQARRQARSNAGAGYVTRAAVAPFTVKISGLKPGTNYEYKSFCDGFDDAQVFMFTTESEFQLPNSSFEEWGEYRAKTMLGNRDIIFPGTGTSTEVGNRPAHFWDTGNEGGATASIVLTNKSTDMVHSGQYSAKLASNSALGIIAAGNLFIGEYVKTDGTSGVLSLGREYNGSHPTKVRLWVNYRPGGDVTVKSKEVNNVDIVSGGTDHGQIYIALSDGPVSIITKDDSTRKLFNPDDQQILAYNQITWTENFGPDGQLQMVEIPFIYFERAKNKRPTHIILTVAASKFGDYYSGSASTVMYLDDIELVYE